MKTIAKRKRREPQPKQPTVETELVICIGFERDGSPFVYSADVECNLLSLPGETNAPGGFRIVRSTIRVSVPEVPTVTVESVKGGAV